MDTEYAEKYLNVLLDYQFDMLENRAIWGVNHAEFIFVQTADLISAHENLRAKILNDIEQTLLRKDDIVENTQYRPQGFIQLDFIWFLVHWMKWPEFRELAKTLRKSPNDVWTSNLITRSSDVILNALEPDWDDREFYNCFS